MSAREDPLFERQRVSDLPANSPYEVASSVSLDLLVLFGQAKRTYLTYSRNKGFPFIMIKSSISAMTRKLA